MIEGQAKRQLVRGKPRDALRPPASGCRASGPGGGASEPRRPAAEDKDQQVRGPWLRPSRGRERESADPSAGCRRLSRPLAGVVSGQHSIPPAALACSLFIACRRLSGPSLVWLAFFLPGIRLVRRAGAPGRRASVRGRGRSSPGRSTDDVIPVLEIMAQVRPAGSARAGDSRRSCRRRPAASSR
jgi:hypothetical protein